MNLNLAAPSGGTVEISELAFGREFNEPLVHQVVVAYLAGARQGTRKQLTRAEVSGGGKKPWKQKGTGRARAGSSRSPLWRSGGIIFAARPQDHSQKVNRKMYQGALRCIASELIRQNRLIAIDTFSVDTPEDPSPPRQAQNPRSRQRSHRHRIRRHQPLPVGAQPEERRCLRCRRARSGGVVES